MEQWNNLGRAYKTLHERSVEEGWEIISCLLSGVEDDDNDDDDNDDEESPRDGTLKHDNSAEPNWEIVVLGLIQHMAQAGYITDYASNGEDSIVAGVVGESWTPQDYASKVCECEEGQLEMRRGDERYTLYTALGNAPSELVHDYSWKQGTDHGHFDATLDAWSDAWVERGDTCPTKSL